MIDSIVFLVLIMVISNYILSKCINPTQAIGRLQCSTVEVDIEMILDLYSNSSSVSKISSSKGR